MKNIEVARLLNRIADILEFQGIEFKPTAYRKAATAIETMSKDIYDLYVEGKLEEIPGVGKHISEKISEFLKYGKIAYYQKLRKSVPIDLENILKIPEIGPKKAKILYNKLRIRNLVDLKLAALTHKIRNLNGMGIKTENYILKGISMIEGAKDRVLLGFAYPIAKEIEKKLSILNEVEIVNVAGSVRRMKETVGDIDIIVISNYPNKVMDHFIKMGQVNEIISKGNTKSSIRLDSGIQVDLRVIPSKSYGAALNYFTGSKAHNVALRRLAQSKGLKLNEYGIYKKNRYLCGSSEEEVYRTLGLRYIEPELRENNGEIESSKHNQLPRLIGYNSINGDLHLHTKLSDGLNNIDEMTRASKALGYKYIAITDHMNLAIAGNLTDKNISSYLREIRKVNIEGIEILAGSEVNITKSGSLDIKKSSLQVLDIVIGSVHSHFKMDKQDMTRRLLQAMDNEYLTILGHISARLIGKRDPIEFDTTKVFQKAKENNIILEINSQPDRLDINSNLIREAKSYGIKFVINTDSHSIDNLNYINLGIGQARRGWLEENSVVNTLSLKRFKKLL